MTDSFSCLKLIRYICLCFHHLFSFLIYGFKVIVRYYNDTVSIYKNYIVCIDLYTAAGYWCFDCAVSAYLSYITACAYRINRETEFSYLFNISACAFHYGSRYAFVYCRKTKVFSPICGVFIAMAVNYYYVSFLSVFDSVNYS